MNQKKIILKVFFCWLACVVNAQPASEKTITWDFPVKYGTEEWENLKTVEDRFHAYNIPDEIIQKNSTTELVKVCMAYPAWGLMTAYNDRMTGLSVVVRLFNGFRELLNRDDAATELLKTYNNLDPRSVESDWTPLQQGLYSFEIEKIEMFFNTNRMFNKLTKVEIQNLKVAVVSNYQKKKMFSQIYSTDDLSATVGIGLKIVRKVDPDIIKVRTDMATFSFHLRSSEITFWDSAVELIEKTNL